MSIKHGVYAIENETSIKITKSSSGLPVYLVTAPVHRATDPKINVPQICYKLSDVSKYFGFEAGNHDFTSNKVAEIFFQYEAIAPVVLINVLDPSKHFTQFTKQELTLTTGIGIISKKNIDLSSIEVFPTGENAVALAKNTDYFATLSDGYIKIELDDTYNAGVLPGSLLVTYKVIDPSKVTNLEVIGTSDALGNKTGLELVNSIFRKYKLVPSILAAPKFSSVPSVAAILKTKANNISTFFKCMTLIDHADDIYFSDYPAYKTSKNINDPSQVCLYGYGTIGDYHYEPSILIGAQMLRVDMTHEDRPCESMSNKSLPIDGACIFIEGEKIELNLEHDEANYLNENGIVTIYNSPTGWVSWGNFTACYPENQDPKDLWINWKRVLFYYENDFILNNFSAVDGMVRKRFVQNALTTYNRKFSSEVKKEYVLAGRMEWTSDDNSSTDIVSGLNTFKIYLTGSPTAQGIIGEFEMDVDRISELIGS